MDQKSAFRWRAEISRQLAGATHIMPLRRTLSSSASSLSALADLLDPATPAVPLGMPRQGWCKGAAMAL